MELKIIADEVQKLLDRRNITGKLHFSGKKTPSRMWLIEELAKKLKVEKNLIVIKEIKTIYGSNTADFEAHIYDSLEKKDRIEPKYLLKRIEVKVSEKKEKASTEEKPAEVKKEEAPKEEKKEEAKSAKEAVKEVPKEKEKKETPKVEEKKE
jgi:ribosomal protein S24E